MITEEQIKKWNEDFTAQDAAGKRMLIAKDVIKQLRAKTYIASSTYLTLSDSFKEEYNVDESLQKCFDGLECEVCALGSVFMSHIKFNNQFTVQQADGTSAEDMTDVLKDYFDFRTLTLMEGSFEQFELYAEGSEDTIDASNLDEYHADDVCISDGISTLQSLGELKISIEEYLAGLDLTRNLDRDTRLRVIMQNIIDNNGEFKTLCK